MRQKQEPRGFGHVDAIDAHHAGPEARWAKQARRAAKAAAIQAAKREKEAKAKEKANAS